MQNFDSPALPAPPVPPVPAFSRAERTSNRKNLILLIHLRWIAVIGQIATISFVQLGLGVVLPLSSMAVVLCGLALLNLASLWWLKNHDGVSNRGLFLALMLDVGALTVQLFLSGGATNPFIFLYLLQVTIAASLLDVAATWAIVAVACGAFACLVVLYRPLVLPGNDAGKLFDLHIIGTLVCFALNVGLLVLVATRINQNLRERDARLAALRQQAMEQDHIVRMGLLASGAAHELGTPLASLSVILNDWRRMPQIASSGDMTQELGEMQAALDRCKSIVTGILLVAGEARGEAAGVTTVNRLLDEMVQEWRTSRSASTLAFANEFGVDLPIVSDAALKQVVYNVLDNAFEVSPQFVGLRAARRADDLVLHITDRGPGFAPAMLAQFGKPYRSSKGRLGGGLGLFLVVNVVRKLGGMVAGRNLQQGAEVTITLPLSTLALGTHQHGQ